MLICLFYSRLVIATTVNQGSRVTATIIQEICCDLNVIVLSRAKPPHPIVIPPFVGRVSHTIGEVVFPKVDGSGTVFFCQSETFWRVGGDR